MASIAWAARVLVVHCVALRCEQLREQQQQLLLTIKKNIHPMLLVYYSTA